MQSDRHERISERAYRIWLAEGCVHGKDEEHWHRAEREISEEEQRVAAALADRAAGGAKTSGATAPRRPRAASAGATPAGDKSGSTAAAPSRPRGRRPKT